MALAKEDVAMTPKEQIQDLKEQILCAKSSFQKQQSLAEQREELEKKESQLQKSIEELQKKVCHQSSEKKLSPTDLQRSLQQQKEQLETLTLHKREVDHQMDEVDEDFEPHIQQLKQRLVRSILQASPPSHASWKELEQKGKSLLEAQEFLRIEIEGGRDVTHFLNQALEARRTAGKRGFLNRIFGRNPSVIQAQYLEKAMKAALLSQEKKETALPSALKGTALPDLAHSHRETLANLAKEIAQPMAVRKIDTLFPALFQTLEEQIASFTQAFEKLDGELESNEQAMDQWMESQANELCKS